jgi:glycosyltransferase involved in cell wall biosynthesis
MPKICFLYTELPRYWYDNVCYLAANYEIQFLLVSYKVDHSVAPYQFDDAVPFGEHHFKTDFATLSKLVTEFKPELLVVTGLVDLDYLRITKIFRNRIPTLLNLDSFYRGDLRQKLLLFLANLGYVKNFFSNILVPGQKHKDYALKLGFKPSEIQLGLYCSSPHFFNRNNLYDGSNLAHEIIYAGRLVEYKWILELCSSFLEIVQAKKVDWKLVIIGNGNLKGKIPQHPQIEIIGFLQPEELIVRVKCSAAFCLPSLVENWGVAVHDFCCMGKILLLSDGVGASEMFLKDSYNGYIFKSGSKESLKSALEKLFNLTPELLLLYSRRSSEMSNNLNPDLWSLNFHQFLLN